MGQSLVSHLLVQLGYPDSVERQAPEELDRGHRIPLILRDEVGVRRAFGVLLDGVPTGLVAVVEQVVLELRSEVQTPRWKPLPYTPPRLGAATILRAMGWSTGIGAEGPARPPSRLKGRSSGVWRSLRLSPSRKQRRSGAWACNRCSLGTRHRRFPCG